MYTQTTTQGQLTENWKIQTELQIWTEHEKKMKSFHLFIANPSFYKTSVKKKGICFGSKKNKKKQ